MGAKISMMAGAVVLALGLTSSVAAKCCNHTHGPHPEEPRSGVSKDEWRQPGHMVRDGAARLLTMRVQ
jgi:hypothetical protein